MSDKKQNGRGMFGKGYYIALILCAAAIGISGYLYYRNANEATPVLQEPDIQPTLSVAALEEDFQVAATVPGTTGATMPTEKTTPNQKRILKTAAPVSGQTVAGYAMDCLSYN